MPSHAQAIFCLQQAAAHAAGYALAASVGTLLTVRAGLSAGVLRVLPDSVAGLLRRGRNNLPLGVGLGAACLGLKHGIEHGILAIDEEHSQPLTDTRTSARSS